MSRLKGMEELFGDTGADEIIEVPVSECIPYHNHKFDPKRSNYEDLKESIRINGIIQPILVRMYQGSYEIIAGHRRFTCAVELGMNTVPAIVKNLSDNEAWVIVSETNINQSSLQELPLSKIAEIIFDYHSAIKAQGKRTDLMNQVKTIIDSESENSDEDGLIGEKSSAGEKTGKGFDMSSRSISRYLRIYQLNAELKELLDDGKLPLYGAVELSYIDLDGQEKIADAAKESGKKIDMETAKTLRSFYEDGCLDASTILSAFQKEKKTGKKGSTGFKKMKDVYQQFFTLEMEEKEVEQIVTKALTMYFKREES